MNEEYIDYGKLIDDAMHIIVKKALEYVKKNGLPKEHHFFISFLTWLSFQISINNSRRWSKLIFLRLWFDFWHTFYFLHLHGHFKF